MSSCFQVAEDFLEIVQFLMRVMRWESLYELGAGSNGADKFVVVCEPRVHDLLVLELYGVAEAFTVGGLDMATMSAIMFWRGGKIPATD